jgi:iron(III) transport system substrate-binding protein
MQKGFAAAYPGIQIEFFRAATGQMLPRLDQERTNKAVGADSAFHAERTWFETNKDALVASLGPAYKQHWTASKFAYQQGKYFVPNTALFGVAYNTQVLQSVKLDPIATYQDMLQPQLKGVAGIAPPVNSTAILQWWFAASTPLGAAAGLQKLAALTPRTFPSVVPLAQSLAAGELAVAAPESISTVQPLIDAGAPVKLVYPKPFIGIGQYAGIVEWASHPNAAQVLQNWLMSPEGQIAINGPGDLMSVLPLRQIPNPPSTMQEFPADVFVADGSLTAEQKTWYDTVWVPVFGK